MASLDRGTWSVTGNRNERGGGNDKWATGRWALRRGHSHCKWDAHSTSSRGGPPILIIGWYWPQSSIRLYVVQYVLIWKLLFRDYNKEKDALGNSSFYFRNRQYFILKNNIYFILYHIYIICCYPIIPILVFTFSIVPYWWFTKNVFCNQVPN